MGARAHRTPAPRRKRGMWGKALANPASLRGLAAARAALADEQPGPRGDDALAMREQLRVEAQQSAQRSLPLGFGG